MIRAFAASLLLLLAACDSGVLEPLGVNVYNLSQDPADLIGSWTLYSSTSSGQGEPPTTRPIRYVNVLTFSPDGTYTRASSRGVDETSTWEVRRGDPDGAYGFAPALYLDGVPNVFGIEDDQLFLDDRAQDGSLSEYRR